MLSAVGPAASGADAVVVLSHGACRTILAAMLWTRSSFWMRLAGARAMQQSIAVVDSR